MMATNGPNDWQYRDLRERIDTTDKAWRERLNEIIVRSTERLTQMDAEVENLRHDYNQTTAKTNESIATLIAQMNGVQTHIQNRLLWAVTSATVVGSLLSGFVGHLFFK